MDAGKEQHYAEEKNDHYGYSHKQGGSVFFLFHWLLPKPAGRADTVLI